MRFKAGDRVRAQSLDWYNENKDKFGKVWTSGGQIPFEKHMSKWCGKVMTISDVRADHYTMIEDLVGYWTDEMIEGFVEEENIHNKWTGLKVELELSKTVIGVSNVESIHGERFMSGFVKAIIPPKGYQFADENGNIINTTKIVLEKKNEYPKTYEECCKVMNYCCNPVATKTTHKEQLIRIFQFLLLYRDAYWKIAGEEMGLGKPWEPDWKNPSERKYCIVNTGGNITKWVQKTTNKVLSFPTEEMRDAFKENFDPDIEKCKELL